MSDKEDTLMPGHKLVADDGSGIEIAYKGPKNNDGKYLVSVQKKGKKPVLKRMTSADMHNPNALERAKEILEKESNNVPFKHGRFTVTPGTAGTAAKKPAAKKSQGGKRRKTKRRKTRRKRKTRRRSRKRKRRTRRRRR